MQGCRPAAGGLGRGVVTIEPSTPGSPSTRTSPRRMKSSASLLEQSLGNRHGYCALRVGDSFQHGRPRCRGAGGKGQASPAQDPRSRIRLFSRMLVGDAGTGASPAERRSPRPLPCRYSTLAAPRAAPADSSVQSGGTRRGEALGDDGSGGRGGRRAFASGVLQAHISTATGLCPLDLAGD